MGSVRKTPQYSGGVYVKVSYMKKQIFFLAGALVVAVLAWGGVFYWQNLRGVGPALAPSPEDIADAPEATDTLPLNLPPGFSVSIFAKDLPGVRVIEQDWLGNFWVSQTSQGVVSMLEVDEEGRVVTQTAIFKNLNKPHGIAIHYGDRAIYVAEEDKISRAGDVLNKIADLPAGGGHFTRTIGFGPEDRLYVSIGSSCSVCHEKDERRAAIYSMNKDGSDFRQHARGLRNSVFFDWSYVDGRMWATEMGRDLLGDDTPPDEINIIEEGGNYGWPICYGGNIHDGNFDKNVYVRNPCMEPFETPSHIDIPAHSAPLGLAFIPEDPPSHEATAGHRPPSYEATAGQGGWPEEYWYDLLVAYHGSWNRSVPTGYKVVRMKLDAEGNYEGVEDFVSGWLVPSGTEGLTSEGALGRPVDILIRPGGLAYITDDKAGVIYKVTYRGE